MTEENNINLLEAILNSIEVVSSGKPLTAPEVAGLSVDELLKCNVFYEGRRVILKDEGGGSIDIHSPGWIFYGSNIRETRDKPLTPYAVLATIYRCMTRPP